MPIKAIAGHLNQLPWPAGFAVSRSARCGVSTNWWFSIAPVSLQAGHPKDQFESKASDLMLRINVVVVVLRVEAISRSFSLSNPSCLSRLLFRFDPFVHLPFQDVER